MLPHVLPQDVEISRPQPAPAHHAEAPAPIDRRDHSVSSGQLGLRYGRTPEPGPQALGPYDVHGGLSARALLGRTVGPAVGVGFEVGGFAPGGIDLAFELLPVGVAVALPRTGFLMLTGGVRPMASSYGARALLLFPAELRAEFDLGARWRATAVGELRMSPVGRGTIPGTDGFAATLALGWPSGQVRRDESTGWQEWSRGQFVGISAWELRGVRFVGFTVGIQIVSIE
ncbi:hypothetical protein [Sorangium sp. So ce233]|uniref:hypothetical protein n=1 Tax=Sorangium sp. So ce233 TaxID=3133290 RepID=UPI003F629FF4